MRKFRAIGILIVGVLSIMGMPSFASAYTIELYRGTSDSVIACGFPSLETNIYFYSSTPTGQSWPTMVSSSTAVILGGIADTNGCYETPPSYFSTNTSNAVGHVTGGASFYGDYSKIDFYSVFFEPSSLPNFYTTRFISVFPDAGSIVATSTASGEVNAHFYIGNEYPDDDYFYTYQLSRENDPGGQGVFWGSGNGEYITANHGHNFISTTTLDFTHIGKYYWRVTVYKERDWLSSLVVGGKIEVLSTTTSFYVGQKSINSAVFDQIETSFSDLYASTTALLSTFCSPLNSGFDFANCLKTVFVPPVDIVVEGVTQILSRPPLGYLYRFYQIMSSDNIVALPSVILPVPGFSSINLTPWDSFFGTTSILSKASSTMMIKGVSYGDHKSFREIVEPYWEYLWSIILAFAVIMRLLGLRGKTEQKTE